MSITELARGLRASKGTVRDILETLRDHGLLCRDEGTKLYRLGPQLARLGASSNNSEELLAAARPHLVALSESQREIAVLLVPQGDRLLIQLAAEPSNPRSPVLVSATPGRSFPASAGACAKVLRAWSNESRVTSLKTVVGRKRKALDAEIRMTLRNGYALDDEEFMEGVRGASAPVFGPGGRLTALLLVSGLAGSMSINRLRRVGIATRGAADAISSALGAAGAQRL